MTVGGRIEDQHERDYIWVVDGDEFVRLFVLLQMLELVNHYVHRATSRFLIHLVMESRR